MRAASIVTLLVPALFSLFAPKTSFHPAAILVGGDVRAYGSRSGAQTPSARVNGSINATGSLHDLPKLSSLLLVVS